MFRSFLSREFSKSFQKKSLRENNLGSQAEIWDHFFLKDHGGASDVCGASGAATFASTPPSARHLEPPRLGFSRTSRRSNFLPHCKQEFQDGFAKHVVWAQLLGFKLAKIKTNNKAEKCTKTVAKRRRRTKRTRWEKCNNSWSE